MNATQPLITFTVPGYYRCKFNLHLHIPGCCYKSAFDAQLEGFGRLARTSYDGFAGSAPNICEIWLMLERHLNFDVACVAHRLLSLDR